MDNCPPSSKTNITEALHQANEIIIPHCRYFSIASGIRHQARELLIGCFRLARGRGFRAEKRFLQHPLTPKSLELFTLWSQVRPDLILLAKNWRKAIKGSATKEKKPHHPRKQRRKNYPRKKPS